ncbi:hypothetical protein HK105_206819 [Polyrhizophydium stewartii]|uniref:dolichyl-phosphate-mannose--protein mannosyltransferase n=1 Tax=Polyrhizophydium stewartii TaxID=2732419 RepID=A0ABR4N2D1_9FUNG
MYKDPAAQARSRSRVKTPREDGDMSANSSPRRPSRVSLEELPAPFDLELKPTFFAYSERRGPQNVNMGIVLLLVLVAAAVRLYNLAQPPEVVFDEVHFGGFGSKYINSQFFMDVHPPLGKLIIAGSGVLLGYNGSFSFKSIGLNYVENNVPYVAMRSVPAMFGVMLSPIAYTTMRNFGFSSATAVLTGVLVMIENSFVCQFRLIMLDAFLVFFTALTAMLWTEFRRAYDRPFSPLWWRTLAFTGISLGLTLSVKWVGLFTIALIGVATLQDLWSLLTDGSVPMPVFTRHFLARALCLIVLPLSVYAFFFRIHFMILTEKGTGAGFMSPEFQSTLGQSDIADTYAEVAYGSKIIIRHEATRGGYLHSHPHNYPGGSKQQQITCYPFRDENSWFRVKPAFEYVNNSAVDPVIEGFNRLTHGSVVRLEHTATQKHLHSHDVRPGFNDDKDYNEVSGYGVKGHVGDTNDYWVVELLDHDDDTTSPDIAAVHSRLRFRHQNTGCYLFSRSNKLPEWGFKQQEVTCAKNGLKKLSVWRIEYNEHPEMPDGATLVNYKRPGFFAKLIELHKVMWQVNSGLKGSHPFDSRPDSWPLLRRGISFWHSKTDGSTIYLLGNPLIWFSAFASVLVFVGYELLEAIAAKRSFAFVNLGFLKEAVGAAWFFFLGWALHYLPFFIMHRQLFLHHYLPALYFSILLLGALFEVVTLKLRRYGQLIAAIAFGAAAIWTFLMFSPLSYGYEVSRSRCESLKWRSAWDFDCSRSPAASDPEPTNLFDKDADDWPENKPSQFDLGKDEDIFGDTSSQSTPFQMPDLLSVQQSSQYNLSFGASARQNPDDSIADMSARDDASEPNVSMDIGSEPQQSFEISLKGSPVVAAGSDSAAAPAAETSGAYDTSMSSTDDMDLTDTTGGLLATHSIAKLVEVIRTDRPSPVQAVRRMYQASGAAQSPDITGTRDSIGPFFAAMPERLASIPRLSPRRVQSPRSAQSPLATPRPQGSPRSTPRPFASAGRQSIDRHSVGRHSVGRQSLGRRDSIAHFFPQPVAPSPLAQSHRFYSPNQDPDDSCDVSAGHEEHQYDEGQFDDEEMDMDMSVADVQSRMGSAAKPRTQARRFDSSASPAVSASGSVARGSDDEPSASQSSAKAHARAEVLPDMSMTHEESMDIYASQQNRPDSDEAQQPTQSMDVEEAALQQSRASWGGHKRPAFVDNNDTITRFFFEPSAAASTQARAVNVREESDTIELGRALVGAGNTSSLTEQSADDDQPTPSKSQLAGSTPARRNAPRRSASKVTPLQPSEPASVASSRASKKRQTPAPLSSTPEMLKSALKTSTAVKQDQGGADESPMHTPLSVNFDVGSPITRSRSKALLASGVGSFSGHLLDSLASPSPLAQKSADRSRRSTPARTATPGTAKRRSSRKSLSGRLIEDLASIRDDLDDSTVETGAAQAPSEKMLRDADDDQQQEASEEHNGPSAEMAAPRPAAGVADEENLLDEHMSMVESSFYHEAEPAVEQTIATLADFLSQTGIEFMDSLKTKLLPSVLDYVKSACLYFPELEIYEFGCRELEQYISEGRVGLDEIEAEADANSPLIFFEFEKGTQEERDDIIDKRVLDEFEKQLSLVISDASVYRNDLKAQIENAERDQSNQEASEKARIAHLTQLEAEQSAEIDALTKELDELMRQSETESSQRQQIEATMSEIEQAIATFEDASKDLMVFDPEELPHLRHEYKTVVLTHLWRPTELSTSRYVFVFDDVIEVAFLRQGPGFSVNLSLMRRSDDTKLSKIWLQTNAGFEVLDGVGVNNVQKILASYEGRCGQCTTWPHMKQVLDDVALTWENIKVFWREVDLTRQVCPLLEIEPEAMDSHALSIRCVFFSYAARARFGLRIGFSDAAEGMFHYPCSNWSAVFEPHYGAVSEKQVIQELSKVEAHSPAAQGPWGTHIPAGLVGGLCAAARALLEGAGQ